MKRNGVWIVPCALCLFCAPASKSQQFVAASEPEAPRASAGQSQASAAPRLLKFTGTFQDRLGRPMTGVVGVTFALYKEREGGAPIWMETHNAELDDQGRYTTLLGASKSDGVPLELFASGEARWLGVQLQIPGEEEQPRTLLVSVPYALKAADAETLGGKPVSAFVLAGASSEPTGRHSGNPATELSRDWVAVATADTSGRVFSHSTTYFGNTLHAEVTDTASSSNHDVLILEHELTSGASGAGFGTGLLFRGTSGGGGVPNYDQARIRTITSGGNNSHGLAFEYRPDFASTTLTEAMRIDWFGAAQFTSPTAFQLNAGSNGQTTGGLRLWGSGLWTEETSTTTRPTGCISTPTRTSGPSGWTVPRFT